MEGRERRYAGLALRRERPRPGGPQRGRRGGGGVAVGVGGPRGARRGGGSAALGSGIGRTRGGGGWSRGRLAGPSGLGGARTAAVLAASSPSTTRLRLVGGLPVSARLSDKALAGVAAGSGGGRAPLLLAGGAALTIEGVGVTGEGVGVGPAGVGWNCRKKSPNKLLLRVFFSLDSKGLFAPKSPTCLFL